MHHVPLYEGLNDVDLYTARRHFQERALVAGEAVFIEGDPADSLVYVLDGSLTISVQGIDIDQVGPGDILGETALFQAGHRLATATAFKSGHILVLQRLGYEALRDVMHPAAATLERIIFELQATRLRALNDRISLLGPARVDVRRPGEWFFGAISALFGRGGVFSPDRVPAEATMRKSRMFAEASDEALGLIAPAFSAESYGPGSVLCTEGEPGECMFLLDEGEVEVVTTAEERVLTLATLRPGAAFGMIALIENRPRMSSCISRTRVVVQRLPLSKFHELMAEPYVAGSVFRRALIKVLMEQIALGNAQFADLHTRATPELAPIRLAAMVADTLVPHDRRD